MFPSSHQLNATNGVPPLIGPLILLFGIGCSIALVAIYAPRPRPSLTLEHIMLAVFALGALTIGIVHVGSAQAAAAEANAWRFDVPNVRELRVIAVPDDTRVTSATPIHVTDQTTIQHGLRYLTRATGYQRNHEGFSACYRIEIILATALLGKTPAMDLCTLSNRNTPVSIVTPTWAEAYAPSISIGDYDAPDFAGWLKQTLRQRGVTVR